MTKHRLLICDDEPHIGLALGMKFRKGGFEVQTARNGQEGWEAILKQSPDLLITDCTMPRMDGIELCRRIRRTPELEHLPIFMLTARGFELDPLMVRDELRIARLVLKPFSPRELFQAAQETLGLAPQATAAR